MKLNTNKTLIKDLKVKITNQKNWRKQNMTNYNLRTELKT